MTDSFIWKFHAEAKYIIDRLLFKAPAYYDIFTTFLFVSSSCIYIHLSRYILKAGLMAWLVSMILRV